MHANSVEPYTQCLVFASISQTTQGIKDVQMNVMQPLPSCHVMLGRDAYRRGSFFFYCANFL